MFSRTGEVFRALRVRRPDALRLPLLLTCLGVSVAVLLALLLGPVAQYVAGPSVIEIADPEKRAAAENAVRQTVLAAVGGGAALITLLMTTRTYLLSQRGQVADRYVKAVAMLTSSNENERIGGVLALESLMGESAAVHGAVVEVIASYIRRVTCEDDVATARPGADVQAAITVLCRRPTRYERRPLDLRGARLAGADMTGIQLSGADLRGVRAERATLTCADLRRANLAMAQLAGVDADGADFTASNLAGSDLSGSSLRRASFRGADLTEAAGGGADVFRADFTGARTRGSSLV